MLSLGRHSSLREKLWYVIVDISQQICTFADRYKQPFNKTIKKRFLSKNVGLYLKEVRKPTGNMFPNCCAFVAKQMFPMLSNFQDETFYTLKIKKNDSQLSLERKRFDENVAIGYQALNPHSTFVLVPRFQLSLESNPWMLEMHLSKVSTGDCLCTSLTRSTRLYTDQRIKPALPWEFSTYSDLKTSIPTGKT